VKTHAVRVHAAGGPEVLRYEQVELAPPAAGELRIRHSAIGLNFIDVYHRSGLYPLPALPAVLGLEAAGVVEALGEGVQDFVVGDRVAYASRPMGAYAQMRNLPAGRAVRLPREVGEETAAALMLKGLTAWYLLHRTFVVRPGQAILVHAAAGGVGTLLCAWATHLGARVIGTVGSEEKAALAREHGCAHTILYRAEDIAARVRDCTDGRGVAVVYDSVGRDTLQASLDSLAPLGMLVSFGQSSGSPPALELGELARRGSLFLTRPSLMDYTARDEDLAEGAGLVLEQAAAGILRPRIGQRWPLEEAAEAHRALESRRTQGATVLLPGPG
jgi:NADPH2:quinone reductase